MRLFDRLTLARFHLPLASQATLFSLAHPTMQFPPLFGRQAPRLGAFLFLAIAGGLSRPAMSQTAPQLGKASLKEVLAALTPDEKVRLVIGVGFYPSGFPAGMLPPGPPGGDKQPEKVAAQLAAPTPCRA